VYDLLGKLLTDQDVFERTTRLNFLDFVTGQHIAKMMSDGKPVKEWKVIRE
jgi:hypothetical protein